MNSRKHVLAVGGTPQTGAAIQAYFSAEGFRAGLAANGHALLGIMARDPADLVITELALPGEDSFSIIRLLRERHGCGVIVLTAKSDLTDRVAALEAGADDYMLKPHEPRELLARARSVMRRANETGKTGASACATIATWPVLPVVAAAAASAISSRPSPWSCWRSLCSISPPPSWAR